MIFRPLNQGERGFTLIEIVVVMFLIALVSTAIVSSVRGIGLDSIAQDSAQRLANLLKFSEQQSFLKQQPYGLVLNDQGYQFARYDLDAEHWQIIAHDTLLGEHQIHAKLNFTLEMDGKRISLQPSKKQLEPQILTDANGHTTPFILTIRRQNEPLARLSNLVDGYFTVEAYS